MKRLVCQCLLFCALATGMTAAVDRAWAREAAEGIMDSDIHTVGWIAIGLGKAFAGDLFGGALETAMSIEGGRR